MAAQRGDGLDVGLDAGAAARIRSRDAKDSDRVFHWSISVRAVFPPHPPAAAKAPAGKLSQRWSAVASREGGTLSHKERELTRWLRGSLARSRAPSDEPASHLRPRP